MNLIADLHTHTLASGHAYSTLRENVARAAETGLPVLGIADHAPGMAGTTTQGYFANMKVWGRRMLGVRVLRGVELNILNENGEVDLPDDRLLQLDYGIASLHSIICASMGREGNTQAYINAMAHPRVKCIGHPDDGHFPVDFDALAAAARENGVALELNNASLTPVSFRLEGHKNATEVLRACAKYGASVLVGTDSHICDDVGNFSLALELLNKTGFPAELVVNADMRRLEAFLGIELG